MAPLPLRDRVATAAVPLPDIADSSFASHFDSFAPYKVLLLGDGSHGTSESYRARAEITQYMVQNHGFNIIAIEVDWPDAEAVDRSIRQRPGFQSRLDKKEKPFKRFPTRMWRNKEVQDLVEWLRNHNASLPKGKRAGFYGFDLYSMGTSIGAVIDYLERVDPEMAKTARRHYGCLESWAEDPQRYGLVQSKVGGMKSYEEEVILMLQDLLSNRLKYSADRHDGEEFHSSEQNPHIVADAEEYYREMYYSSSSSWSLRDAHMFKTLERLLNTRPPGSKALVWAHNSHIGDARYTSMCIRNGELNLGQLCRERLGRDAVAILGCGTHIGTVAGSPLYTSGMKTPWTSWMSDPRGPIAGNI